MIILNEPQVTCKVVAAPTGPNGEVVYSLWFQAPVPVVCDPEGEDLTDGKFAIFKLVRVQ